MNKTDTDHIGRCNTCRKFLYTDKARAKMVGRRHHPRKQAYPCPETVGTETVLWHVGSVPKLVRQGFMTRDEASRSRSSAALTVEGSDTEPRSVLAMDLSGPSLERPGMTTPT